MRIYEKESFIPITDQGWFKGLNDNLWHCMRLSFHYQYYYAISGFRFWPTIPFKIIIIKADGNYSCQHSLCMWSSCAHQLLTIADNWIKNKHFSVHWSWPSWHVNKTESHFMPVLSRSIKPSALYKIEFVKVDVLLHSVERPQPLVLFKLSLSTKWPWLSLYFLCFFHNFTKLMIIVHQDRIQVSVLSLPMQLME